MIYINYSTAVLLPYLPVQSIMASSRMVQFLLECEHCVRSGSSSVQLTWFSHTALLGLNLKPLGRETSQQPTSLQTVRVSLMSQPRLHTVTHSPS